MRLHHVAGPIVFAVALAAFGLVSPRAEIIEAVLVKVNGEIFTKTDLEARQNAALEARLRLQDQSPEERRKALAALSDADLAKILAEVTPDILLSFVNETLVIQRGKELGLKLSDDRFTEWVENIKKEQGFKTEEEFQNAIKSDGLTMATLRNSLERSYMIGGVRQREVEGRITVTETDVKTYYETHRQEFTTPSAMTLREILVAVPTSPQGLNVAQDSAARAKADGLRARLAAGEKFEKLVAEASDAPSKSNGGLIPGTISKEDLAPALRPIFAPLKAGDITPVIQTTSGYQIFRLETFTDRKVLTFDEARSQIADRVADAKRASEFMKYVQKLRAQAIIDWKNAELKKMFEKRAAEEVAASAKSAAEQR